MSRLRQEEIVARLQGAGDLIYASHDINQWTFELCRAPSDAAPSTIGVYEGRCKKTGVKAHWPIDQVDIDAANGDFEVVRKQIHVQFGAFLVLIGTAVSQARIENSGLILPRHMKHSGKFSNAFKLLEKGDIDH